MSVVAEFTVPADSFALEHASTSHPRTAVEAERLASHSPEWALPFLWASGGDGEAFTEAVREDPTVADVALIEEVGEGRLYKIEWSDDVIGLITEMINKHAIILEANARDGEWHLKVRFAEDAQVSQFREHFAERGYTFTVDRLYHPTAPRQREFGLTAQQREALVTAGRRGYFDVPRTLTTEELADALGVSSNAASQRMRRGTGNLVRNTLTVGRHDDAD